MPSPTIRVPPEVLAWLKQQQRPRETIGQTLRRVLPPSIRVLPQKDEQR